MSETTLNPSRRWSLWLLIATALAGIGLALFATWQTLQLQGYELEVPPACGTIGVADCSVVQASSHAMELGVPVAWWGLLFYVWIGVTAAVGLARGGLGPVALSTAFMFTTAALLVTLYKAYVLVFVLKALCSVCLAMYGVNLAIALLVLHQAGFSWARLRDGLAMQARLQLGTQQAGAQRSRVWPVYLGLFATFVLGFAAMKIYVETRSLPIDVEREVRNHFLLPQQSMAFEHEPPVWGNPNARVTLAVFSDFQCPSCRAAAAKLPGMLWEFRDQVRLYFVNFPLDIKINPHVQVDLHKHAGLAARAAICAQQLGDFWPLHDQLFANQAQLSLPLLLQLAEQQGFDVKAFAACIYSNETLQRVQQDIEFAHQAGVSATPSLMINGRMATYWFHPEVLRGIVRSELRRAASVPADAD